MPLFGSNFSSSLESRHGTMWEATRISSRLDLVTAHLLPNLLKSSCLYQPCPTLEVTRPFRSVLVGFLWRELGCELVLCDVFELLPTAFSRTNLIALRLRLSLSGASKYSWSTQANSPTTSMRSAFIPFRKR